MCTRLSITTMLATALSLIIQCGCLSANNAPEIPACSSQGQVCGNQPDEIRHKRAEKIRRLSQLVEDLKYYKRTSSTPAGTIKETQTKFKELAYDLLTTAPWCPEDDLKKTLEQMYAASYPNFLLPASDRVQLLELLLSKQVQYQGDGNMTLIYLTSDYQELKDFAKAEFYLRQQRSIYAHNGDLTLLAELQGKQGHWQDMIDTTKALIDVVTRRDLQHYWDRAPDVEAQFCVLEAWEKIGYAKEKLHLFKEALASYQSGQEFLASEKMESAQWTENLQLDIDKLTAERPELQATNKTPEIPACSSQSQECDLPSDEIRRKRGEKIKKLFYLVSDLERYGWERSTPASTLKETQKRIKELSYDLLKTAPWRPERDLEDVMGKIHLEFTGSLFPASDRAALMEIQRSKEIQYHSSRCWDTSRHLSWVYTELKDYAKAEFYLRQSFGDPYHAYNLNDMHSLAELQEKQENWQNPIETYQQIIESCPNDEETAGKADRVAKACEKIGYAKEKLHLFKEALAYYQAGQRFVECHHPASQWADTLQKDIDKLTAGHSELNVK